MRLHPPRKKGKCRQPKVARQKPKFIPYNEYLLSKWWKRKRVQKLKSTEWKCERCGEKATQVHHKHYRSLWKEKNSDLESICAACHQIQHECLVQCDSHLRSINSPV